MSMQSSVIFMHGKDRVRWWRKMEVPAMLPEARAFNWSMPGQSSSIEVGSTRSTQKRSRYGCTGKCWNSDLELTMVNYTDKMMNREPWFAAMRQVAVIEEVATEPVLSVVLGGEAVQGDVAVQTEPVAYDVQVEGPDLVQDVLPIDDMVPVEPEADLGSMADVEKLGEEVVVEDMQVGAPVQGEPATEEVLVDAIEEDVYAQQIAPLPFAKEGIRVPAPDVNDVPKPLRMVDSSWQEPLQKAGGPMAVFVW